MILLQLSVPIQRMEQKFCAHWNVSDAGLGVQSADGLHDPCADSSFAKLMMIPSTTKVDMMQQNENVSQISKLCKQCNIYIQI